MWFTSVPHCGYMRYHETKGMILVDLDESYQNIPKSLHRSGIVVLLWGLCFISFAPKSHLGQTKSSQIDLYYTTRQVLKETPSYDHTCLSVHIFGGLENFLYYKIIML